MSSDDVIELFVNEDGSIDLVYEDDLVAALIADDEASAVSTRRASHVEPAETFGVAGGGWIADMRPVGGPLIGDGVEARDGLRGFATRADALAAEVAYLRAAMAERPLGLA